MSLTGTKTAVSFINEIKPPNGNGKSAATFPKAPRNSSLMEKVDSKGRETVELSRGSVWLIGIGFLVLGALLTAAPQLFSFIRDDQSKSEQLKILQKDVESLRQESKDIKESLERIRESQRQQEIQNAKVAGYELGAADKVNNKKEQK